MNPKREVCFLVGKNDEVLWADAGSPGKLPDSRARWEAIWERRDQLVEVAHSHPHGPAAFSQEDETTMVALRSALGEHTPRFSVVAPNAMVVRDSTGDHLIDNEEPWWANLMRLASGMPPHTKKEE